MVGSGLIRVAFAVVASTLLVLVACASEPSAGAGPASERLLALVDLAAQRVQVADTVAASKWVTDAPIKDQDREQAVLASAATKSVQLGIDPAVSVQVFTDQIEASKAVQYALYSHWSAHPARAPATRPDLAQVRLILDRITDDLLAQLAATQGLRADLGCPAQLASAQRRVELARVLDQVHRDALSRALISLCRAPHADGAGVRRAARPAVGSASSYCPPWRLDIAATPTYSSYRDVVLPQVEGEGWVYALSVLPARRLARRRLQRGCGPAGDPPAQVVPGVQSSFHHGGGAGVGRGEAFWCDRAVQSRQGCPRGSAGMPGQAGS